MCFIIIRCELVKVSLEGTFNVFKFLVLKIGGQKLEGEFFILYNSNIGQPTLYLFYPSRSIIKIS